jgi:hypothetical protein
VNPKRLLILCLATALLVLAGLFLYDAGAPPSETEVEGQMVFAELMKQVNDVSELVIVTSEGEFTVRSVEGTWGLMESAGYPVLRDKVRDTLLSLANLEKVERKTSNPALFEKLGVQPVADNGAAETPSASVTAKTADGQILAALIVGKARATGGGSTFYARRPAEPESWLVRGKRPPLFQEGSEWLDKSILEVKRDVVRAARTTHADGEIVSIAKLDSETNYTVLGRPADRELSYASVAGGIAGSMQYLNFEAVKPIEDFKAPETALAVTSLWTRDGVRMTVEIFEPEPETIWAVFHADFDLAGGPELPAAVGPDPAALDATATATARPEAEVRAEILELNARLDKWAYKLPQYSKTNFTKRLEELLKPLPEESASEPAPPGDGGAALDLLEGPAPEVEEAKELDEPVPVPDVPVLEDAVLEEPVPDVPVPDVPVLEDAVLEDAVLEEPVLEEPVPDTDAPKDSPN